MRRTSSTVPTSPPTGLSLVPAVEATDRDRAMAAHPTALGERLDSYLDAVGHALRVRGVVTGTPQRTDPARRLIGSIVVDCTALRSAAGPAAPGPAAPVAVIWDERSGWSVGLHHDPTSSSRSRLDAGLLPAPDVVAGFVVDLALGGRVAADRPLLGVAR